MAKMRLFYSPASPYARKVRVLALEAGIDKKIEMINVALTPVAPNADVDKHNPTSASPTTTGARSGRSSPSGSRPSPSCRR